MLHMRKDGQTTPAPPISLIAWNLSYPPCIWICSFSRSNEWSTTHPLASSTDLQITAIPHKRRKARVRFWLPGMHVRETKSPLPNPRCSLHAFIEFCPMPNILGACEILLSFAYGSKKDLLGFGVCPQISPLLIGGNHVKNIWTTNEILSYVEIGKDWKLKYFGVDPHLQINYY